ncbi:MAG: DegV family protein [Bacillota bacterium]|jgi:DegV family protein with EDD domain|nr:DegV family protein [Bacillota bacterium]NLL26490.1 DegV family protein [Erysipelotrichia bacterium]
MIRVFVDSGSSIKQDEKEKYNVEILPLKILLGDKEYLDGVDLTMEDFYHALIEEKQFPKTSLPNMIEAKERVMEYVNQGDDVIVIPLSKGISSTYSTLYMLFQDEEKVHVIDCKTVVGGVRLIVEEINRHRNQPIEVVLQKIEDILPKIRVLAIPNTLEYLYRGGRLSKAAYVAGNAMQLKPFIAIDNEDGGVKMVNKVLGRKKALKILANYLETENCDISYPIVPSYTYDPSNLDELISLTKDKYKEVMIEYDNLDPAIACHWGPGAFGYIFVSKYPYTKK